MFFALEVFLYAPQEECENGIYTGRWYVEKQKEVFTCKIHTEKSFLTVGDLKKIIEEENIGDDCILCFENEKGIRLLENNYSYDYLICNRTVPEQHLPTDDIDELESRRYRDTMVLKLS